MIHVILIDVFVLTSLLSINSGVKTRAYLLKAFFFFFFFVFCIFCFFLFFVVFFFLFCFVFLSAFDFVGEWRPTVRNKKATTILMTLKKCYGQTYSCSKKTLLYANSTVYKMHLALVRISHL